MQEDDKVMQEAAREGDEDGQRTEDAIEKADADFNPDDPDVEGLPENDAAEVANGVYTLKVYACVGTKGWPTVGLVSLLLILPISYAFRKT